MTQFRAQEGQWSESGSGRQSFDFVESPREVLLHPSRPEEEPSLASGVVRTSLPGDTSCVTLVCLNKGTCRTHWKSKHKKPQ